METMNTVLSAFLKLQNLFLVPLQTRAPLLSFHVTCPKLAPTLKKAPLVLWTQLWHADTLAIRAPSLAQQSPGWLHHCGALEPARPGPESSVLPSSLCSAFIPLLVLFLTVLKLMNVLQGSCNMRDADRGCFKVDL